MLESDENVKMNYTGIKPEELPLSKMYGLLAGIVSPRPIGLIATISTKGVDNLAPFSFYQALCAQPPAVMFCPVRNRHGEIKDSHRNALETGEFVANAVTEDMAEAMNQTSAEYPEDVSEFIEAGFTPIKSELIKSSRVSESPVQMECKVIESVELSDGPLGGTVIIGKIVKIHIDERIYDELKQSIISDNYHLIARLGGAEYATIRDKFELQRPKLL